MRKFLFPLCRLYNHNVLKIFWQHIQLCSSFFSLQSLCSYIRRSSCSCDDLGDDDPVGWFEVEEEWDEVDVKMQQCVVSQVRSDENPLAQSQ